MVSRSMLVSVVFAIVAVAGCKSTPTPDAQTPPQATVGPELSEPPGGTTPHHGPPPEGGSPHRGPSPEAIDACKGKKADDACTFRHDDKERTGTCRAREGGGELSCRGERRGGPGGVDPTGGSPP